jgi:cytochrome b561
MTPLHNTGQRYGAASCSLMLAALRLAWRAGSVLPSLTPPLRDWRKLTARFVHLCFYGLMVALLITGWLS